MGNAYFSSEVLKNGSTVNSCCGSYTTMAGCASLQVPVDTTHRELAGNRHKTVVWVKQKKGLTLYDQEGWHTGYAIKPHMPIRTKDLPAAQPSGSGTLLSPWLCHCLFLPCHQPAWVEISNKRNRSDKQDKKSEEEMWGSSAWTVCERTCPA